jgi:predicted RNA-binding Zn-ribbon protein involved in translation (DUF1610 family)
MTDKLHSLLQQLASHPLVTSNLELKKLSDSISHEIKALYTKDASKTDSAVTIDKKSGCYVFEGVSGFFCPSCFDKQQQRVNTKRLNSKLRVCPSCRASITPK